MHILCDVNYVTGSAVSLTCTGCALLQEAVPPVASTLLALKPFLFLFQLIHKIQAFESLGKLNGIYSSGVQTFNRGQKYSLCH